MVGADAGVRAASAFIAWPASRSGRLGEAGRIESGAAEPGGGRLGGETSCVVQKKMNLRVI
jgi:hypothetical protein